MAEATNILPGNRRTDHQLRQQAMAGDDGPLLKDHLRANRNKPGHADGGPSPSRLGAGSAQWLFQRAGWRAREADIIRASSSAGQALQDKARKPCDC